MSRSRLITSRFNGLQGVAHTRHRRCLVPARRGFYIWRRQGSSVANGTGSRVGQYVAAKRSRVAGLIGRPATGRSEFMKGRHARSTRLASLRVSIYGRSGDRRPDVRGRRLPSSVGTIDLVLERIPERLRQGSLTDRDIRKTDDDWSPTHESSCATRCRVPLVGASSSAHMGSLCTSGASTPAAQQTSREPIRNPDQQRGVLPLRLGRGRSKTSWAKANLAVHWPRRRHGRVLPPYNGAGF